MNIFRIATRIATGHIPGKPWLKVFDFDETLVSTGAQPWAVNPNAPSDFLKSDGSDVSDSQLDGWYSDNVQHRIDDGDYSKIPKGWSPEFREFKNMMVEPVVHNQEMFDEMIKMVNSGRGDVVVITARSQPKGIEKILSDYGINVDVYSLGADGSKAIAEGKAYYIESLMEDKGYRNIHFFDDSVRNIDAIKALSVKWNSQHPDDPAYFSTKLVKMSK